MTWATGRTDSELSHWAIMTRATGRADSELSQWAIMTRATGRTDGELSHWAIMTDSILPGPKLMKLSDTSIDQSSTTRDSVAGFF